MKNILLIALLGIFFLSSCKDNSKTQLAENSNITEDFNKSSRLHFDEEIARITNSEIVFVNDINIKVSHWEAMINNSTLLSVSFWDVAIEQEDGEYYIIAKDSIHPSISKIKLILEDEILYECSYKSPVPGSPLTGHSTTCAGCTSSGPEADGECEPKENDKGWYCTDCSQGNCTKSSTVTSGGFLTN